jgi:hypothetical protein
MTRDDFVKKIEKLDEQLIPLSLIVTVVKLPNGALETITNTQYLNDKIKYILNAYDENMELKTCKDIKILDCIIL